MWKQLAPFCGDLDETCLQPSESLCVQTLDMLKLKRLWGLRSQTAVIRGQETDMSQVNRGTL